MNKPSFSNRSRIDIMTSILRNSNGSSTKTRLISKCNLNFRQFNLYKDFLLEYGLLRVSRKEDGAEVFETTDRGKEFLTDYTEIKGILETKERRQQLKHAVLQM